MESNIKVEGRDIYLYDIIDDEVSVNVTKWLRDLEALEDRDPINLYINTRGGDVQHFLAIYDVIQNLKCDVNTIALGYCMSAGAMLLLSGTGVRKAYKNTSIMIHEMKSSINYSQFTDVNIRSKWLEHLNNKIKNIISSHTGKDIEKVDEDIKRDVFMSAEEALEYSIIDEIIEEKE